MGCIFRVGGEDLDVDACLAQCHFETYSVYRKGEARGIKGRVHQHSGFGVAVSEADFGDLKQQIEDAIRFLESNEAELKKLQEFPDVQGRVLDFPVEDRDVAVQCDVFPARLLKLAGDFGIDIEITRYPISSNES
ncbi:MAG TPA: DUF4279 domain-containing protein [Abditibacterium sp.]|jgi:hypothetical protein